MCYSSFPGSYICSFNGSSDLQAIDQNTAIHVYVYDEVNLLTHSGFDFQQSVQFQTATIPCTPTHPGNGVMSIFMVSSLSLYQM